MSKIFLIFLTFILLSFPKASSAITISKSNLSPNTLNTTDQATYHIEVSGGTVESFTYKLDRISPNAQLIEQEVVTLNPGENFDRTIGPFPDPGQYRVALDPAPPNTNSCCSISFSVVDTSVSGSPPIFRNYEPTSPTSKDSVTFVFEVGPGTNVSSFIVDSATPAKRVNLSRTSETEARADMGTFPDGIYTIKVFEQTLSGLKQIGSAIVLTVGTGKSSSDGACTEADIAAGKCTKAAGIPCDGDKGIQTAIGCIHTNPSELINDLLRFITAIAGGIAFLLMLMGAFQMITSAGNPDSLKAGQERFTSAIIGLLFVIFAVLLMQVIGVDILNIPGFNR